MVVGIRPHSGLPLPDVHRWPTSQFSSISFHLYFYLCIARIGDVYQAQSIKISCNSSPGTLYKK